ncbi:LysR family transcriptional regulator [Pseudomonas sp. SZMC_28357]|jgi:DNA-binding transcriptional LysR family regulator|uniref:LysR family transcriptional regulator n=1 Tax=Pseudomonas sp. SZMC_28357 TaxID=3074380 RepID=UPI0028713E2E|nr:LysR family transcriptional regulator [Pseudomonas sp. SZMC_28357]MDR9753365.1 LysR family transcriptional regulator [Pseudomonas sp. SZMC_28357]
MNRVARLGIKQLRIFSALLKEKNLSVVADQMGLTQQAVSANVATLREVFGDPLFVRTGRGVTSTSLAQELAGEVNEILCALDRLIDRAPFDPAQAFAQVNICGADYAHYVALAPRLSDIREQAPHLKLILSELQIDSLAGKMASGEIDIAISLPEYVPANFPRRTLFHEHYVCVAQEASELCHGVVSLDALARQPHVVVSPARANLQGSADGWFEQRGLQRNIILSVPHFLLVGQMVKATGAVAFIPSRLLPYPGLKIVQLEENVSPPGYELIVAWHPHSASSPLINWIVNMLAG